MPNWCSNYLTVSGGKVEEIIEKIKGASVSEGTLFATTVGVIPDEDRTTQWGTKWDVRLNDIADQLDFEDNSYISISFDTAWAPPTEYCKKLNQQYGVDVEITYGEPGCDFFGRFTIDKEGNETIEDYEYHQGQYVLDNESFWETIGDTIDNYIEDEGEDATFEDFINTYCNFEQLTEDDKLKLLDLYNGNNSVEDEE